MDTEHKRKVVVVVNDDPSQLRLTSAILEAEGLEVLSCLDPQQAITQMDQREVPDAIVTDICMPGIDGWRFCRLLRSEQYQRFNQVPILVLSATFSGADAQQLISDLGADAFLPAPYKPAELRSSLNTLLEGRKQRVSETVLILTNGSEDRVSGLVAKFDSTGHSCLIAASEEEAFRLLAETCPDVVIIARDTPTSMSMRLLGEIKRQSLPTVSVIVTEEEDLPQAIELMMQGADGFVCEPFDARELLDLFEQARRERSFIQIEDLLESRLQGIKKNELKYRLLLSSIRSPIVALSDDFKVLYCNDAFSDFFCESNDSLEGRILQDLVSEFDGSWLHSLCMGTLETGVSGEREEKWCDRIINTRVYPTPWGILAVVEDVTERRELESKVARAERLESLTQLAGGIAHDLNNMLTPIIGYSHIANNEDLTPETLNDYLGQVQEAAERAWALAQQLTSFSCQHPNKRELVNLNDVILNTSTVISHIVGDRVTLTTSLADEVGAVKVDSGQIQQLLINLTANATEAMNGSGNLEIKTASLQVDSLGSPDMSELPSGSYTALLITDDGKGIPEDVKAHLFEPFNTTKDRSQGAGLGLPVCYGIVKENGGHIKILSRPGQGTIVKILFPQISEAEDADGYSAEPACPIGETGTVLLVDDEPLVRNLTARVLMSEGFNVLEAANGDEALRIGSDTLGQNIRLLLTDVTMPKMNGVELASRFCDTHPDTRVLLVSGYAEPAATEWNKLKDGWGFLQKPYLPEVLSGKVRSVLAS